MIEESSIVIILLFSVYFWQTNNVLETAIAT